MSAHLSPISSSYVPTKQKVSMRQSLKNFRRVPRAVSQSVLSDAATNKSKQTTPKKRNRGKLYPAPAFHYRNTEIKRGDDRIRTHRNLLHQESKAKHKISDFAMRDTWSEGSRDHAKSLTLHFQPKLSNSEQQHPRQAQRYFKLWKEQSLKATSTLPSPPTMPESERKKKQRSHVWWYSRWIPRRPLSSKNDILVMERWSAGKGWKPKEKKKSRGRKD